MLLVAEECGEAVKAAVDLTRARKFAGGEYNLHPESPDYRAYSAMLVHELEQTAAMCLHMLQVLRDGKEET
jgi:hypothetical protein